MTMEIRRLTPDDAAALWELRLRALRTDPQSFAESAEELQQKSPAEYAGRLGSGRDDNFVFGAFDQVALAGMAGFYRLQQRKERHKGRIWGVYVVPEWRGKGVGRAVMDAVLSSARAIEDLRAISLTVASTQPVAKRLYSSLGFRVFGVEPKALRVDGRFIDDEHMILEL